MTENQQDSNVSETGKTRAIVAHLTLIGWIIALVQNNDKEKDEFASFYIRQMLGLMIIMVVGVILSSIIYYLGLIVQLGALAIWVLSLMGATNGKKDATPVIGEMFQDWFKNV
ncbi:MAG: hypothetical protein COA33_001500 [Fluviicola sp.]|nr:hypothetical protein [Fluviicola sp.]